MEKYQIDILDWEIDACPDEMGSLATPEEFEQEYQPLPDFDWSFLSKIDWYAVLTMVGFVAIWGLMFYIMIQMFENYVRWQVFLSY